MPGSWSEVRNGPYLNDQIQGSNGQQRSPSLTRIAQLINQIKP